ncbi:kinetochore-associated protein NSL1 homolog [Genypterus blacodes]|uniref:kinetochore-associated protein NSL1 homolog n=1 Tax=Genypterus blacodes TaxID=154954 RepID=UPI003F75E85B
MESSASEASPNDKSDQEYRIQATSKKQVVEQINRYKEVLKEAVNGQPELPEETRRVLVQELLANFEADVQKNVLVNGQPWEEAPDDEEDEAIDLESLLDDTIVETTGRRRTYPKQILPHVVHSLKAERKLMGLYKQVVKPQEVTKDPDQESLMSELSESAPGMVKQALQVMKSIKTLQQQAEGLCEILNTKPSQAALQFHQEVFRRNDQSDNDVLSVGGATRYRQPMKRAVEEAAAKACYVPLSKRAGSIMGVELSPS